MRKKKSLALCIAAVLCVRLLADDGGMDFSADIETRWGVCAPWTDSDSRGRFTLGDTSFNAALDAYYGNSSAFAKACFSYSAVDVLNDTDAKDSGNLGGGFNLLLSECWLDYTSSFWGIRIGRQKAAWGKADGIDITNVLCPADMSSFSAMVSDDGKLAVDAARFSMNKDSLSFDAWWIPFFTPAALPETSVSFEKPERTLWNGEYGVKCSGYFPAMDISVYGFYGWDDAPFIDYADYVLQAAVPRGTYKRMLMLGADAAVPLGETVIRMEAAFFPQRHFQKSAESVILEIMRERTTSAKSTERHNQLSALVGIDWMPNGWTITAQYYGEYVFGSLAPIERTDAYTHGASLSLSKTFVNETLEASFSALIGFNDFDAMLNPAVNYSLSDQIKLGCGAYIFIPGPDRDGTYGAYKDMSTLYITAKFSCK